MPFVSPKRVFSIVSFCLTFFLLVATRFANAQLELHVPVSTAPSPIAQRQPVSAGSLHSFWDRRNILLFSAIAAVRTLDYTSTENMLARGREERLIPDDVVHNNPGFASLEAAGAATSIGISYLLHRTGHHRLERWMSIGHVSVTAFGAARNYALQSKHP